jgi:hypothetical protein
MGWMDVVHMPECQLCSLQHLLPLFEFDHFVSTCRMAKLDGFQRGRYEWLVDPPTTEGNPKFEYFFPTFGMSLSSAISLTVFIFLLQVTTQPATLGQREQKLNFMMAALFHFFKPFLLFFLVLCVAI